MKTKQYFKEIYIKAFTKSLATVIVTGILLYIYEFFSKDEIAKNNSIFLVLYFIIMYFVYLYAGKKNFNNKSSRK